VAISIQIRFSATNHLGSSIATKKVIGIIRWSLGSNIMSYLLRERRVKTKQMYLRNEGLAGKVFESMHF
jgi:hypothetical protein